jgi:hypothetical protein
MERGLAAALNKLLMLMVMVVMVMRGGIEEQVTSKHKERDNKKNSPCNQHNATQRGATVITCLSGRGRLLL